MIIVVLVGSQDIISASLSNIGAQSMEEAITSVTALVSLLGTLLFMPIIILLLSVIAMGSYCKHK